MFTASLSASFYCATAFLEWPQESLYNSERDFLFPSIRLNGKKPLSLDSLLKRSIPPALQRADIVGKPIGCYNFRPFAGDQPAANGSGCEVAQEILRHADSRTTLDIYARADASRSGMRTLSSWNTALFPEETPGQLGNARRRNFYGPRIQNLDLTLQKTVHMADTGSLIFRVEAFNAFNHTQFFGPASVNGQRGDPGFGTISSAAAPRLMQLAAKFSF